MGVYHLIIGTGTILVLSFLWVAFAYETDMMATVLSDMYSTLTPDYELGNNYMYFSYFFMVIVIFAWIIKESAREQEKNHYA